MKALILLSALLLSACSNSTMPAWREAPPAAPAVPQAAAAAAGEPEAAPEAVTGTVAAPTDEAKPNDAAPNDGAAVETVPFRLGSSSTTVENMARLQSCTGGQGAALVSAPGATEVYRMVCDDGRVFRATCDMHQCKPL